MRYLILSDIHANLEALRSVLDDAAGQYDTVVCCGDVVGYGPDPNETAEWCRENCRSIVRGNHDKACAGIADLEWFNPVARASALWTQSLLTEPNLQWLRDLPTGPLEVNGFAILHGSPADEDEYLVSPSDVREYAEELPSSVSFFGHTHLQGGFEVHRNGVIPIADADLTLYDSSGYLINPGSVGQPRDGDPAAAWAIYDSDRHFVQYRRTSYDVTVTYRRILDAGLPEVLGLRLYRGV